MVLNLAQEQVIFLFNISTYLTIGNISTAPTNGKHLQLNVGNKTEIESHIRLAELTQID
jgi:hypothetical protein